MFINTMKSQWHSIFLKQVCTYYEFFQYREKSDKLNNYPDNLFLGEFA